jgi:rhamnogalacturonan endolyase
MNKPKAGNINPVEMVRKTSSSGTMRVKYLLSFILFLTLYFQIQNTLGQRIMENLGRGVVAVNLGEGKVFVSWRMLGTDPENIDFNLYRSTGGKAAVKLNKQPLTQSTSYSDAGVDIKQANVYFVKSILKGKEQGLSTTFTLAANAPAQQYLSIPLKTPQGYTPNDASVGDLDGDGEYEVILHQTGHGRDTPANGFTDEPIFQAYKLDGKLLWER